MTESWRCGCGWPEPAHRPDPIGEGLVRYTCPSVDDPWGKGWSDGAAGRNPGGYTDLYVDGYRAGLEYSQEWDAGMIHVNVAIFAPGGGRGGAPPQSLAADSAFDGSPPRRSLALMELHQRIQAGIQAAFRAIGRAFLAAGGQTSDDF